MNVVACTYISLKLMTQDVENAMSGCDAAITTLGGVTDGKRVDYDGNRNVIEAAGILGVTRCAPRPLV